MTTPSTSWKEDIAADEDAVFAGFGEKIAAIQKGRDAKYGTGRALHRKQILAVRARFEVLGGLPAWAAHGLFANPGAFDAVVRLSNGGVDKVKDRAPDIRGYAFKVKGVKGESALGSPATSQDFALINQPAFGSPKAAEFVAMMEQVAKGPAALIGHFIKTFGFFSGLARVKKLIDATKKPFAGFCNETFYSAAPIACGPYACRVRMLPATTEKNPKAADDFGRDLIDRLKKGPLTHDVQLQFFVDEKRTPIEDASVDWSEADAPYVTVGRLTLLQQDLDAADAKAVADEVEGGVVDPWCCLKEHRPLGNVMRARKAVYFASQKGRGLHS